MKKTLALVLVTIGLALITTKAETHQWKANWITHEKTPGGTNTWLAFQKTAKIDKIPQSVTARIACDSKYWLWINGKLVVFEGELKRGPAPGDTYYDKVEIAPFLKDGENDISILMCYFGKSSFSYVGTGIPALIFEAEGDGVEILSNKSWNTVIQTGYGMMSTHKPNYRLAESNICYDARKFPFDWFKTKIEGETMNLGLAVGTPPFGNLVERPIPLWIFSDIKEYEEQSRHGDTIICKLPYNCQMTPYLKVKAPAGKSIRMETDHAFVTNDECLRAEYITKEGEQEYESLGWMNGDFVYYLVPEGVEILELGYRESGYDTKFSGTFRCDDQMLNEYWKRSVRTVYVCMRDTYYDCPERERGQWWGDVVNELASAFYCLSPSSWQLARKGILELTSWQRADGVMYAPLPASNWTRELPLQILAAVGKYGFHQYCFWSGDETIAEQIYGPLHRYLHEVWKTDNEGMPIHRTGDWDWMDWGAGSDRVPLMTCWYALALQAEEQFARITGRTADAEQDREMVKKISEGFDKRFWSGKDYRSKDRTEELADDRVQALAVLAGLVPESRYPAVAESIISSGFASPYMHRFVMEALFKMKRADLAIADMRKRYPTLMRENTTTIDELWDHQGSSNHGWSTGGIVMAGQYIAGISPVEPGFRKFRVSPQLGPLKEVDYSMETKYGHISVSIRKSGKTMKVTLTVPEGTEAVTDDMKTYGPGVHSLTLK